MHLYPMDRVSCQVSPDLTLKYLSRKNCCFPGLLAFLSLDWQREIDEPIVF